MRLAHSLHGPDDAEVVVLSCALGTTQEMWSRQLPSLSERYRVLTYDQPGHGGSDLPGEQPTVGAFADGVIAVLDELEIERVSFCGVSLGGMVGMALALGHPRRVERLVLACSSAHLGPPAQWLERARRVRARGTEVIADAVVGRWFTNAFVRDEPETVARLRSLLVATPREGYAACCEAIGTWDAREAISEIAAPTLVVAGAQDPATTVEDAEALVAGIPGARLCVVDGAAHLANVEQPERFTAAVLEHLGQEVAA